MSSPAVWPTGLFGVETVSFSVAEIVTVSGADATETTLVSVAHRACAVTLYAAAVAQEWVAVVSADQKDVVPSPQSN